MPKPTDPVDLAGVADALEWARKNGTPEQIEFWLTPGRGMNPRLNTLTAYEYKVEGDGSSRMLVAEGASTFLRARYMSGTFAFIVTRISTPYDPPELWVMIASKNDDTRDAASLEELERAQDWIILMRIENSIRLSAPFDVRGCFHLVVQ